MNRIKSFNIKIKQLAILIDPDKCSEDHLLFLTTKVNQSDKNCFCFFVGGSLISQNRCDEIVTYIKQNTNCSVYIFPGTSTCLTPKADAFLLLSLVSGRNAEWLIGKHVAVAPKLKQSGLKIMSTAYLLIDSGRPTTVHYISNTQPIPADKPEIAATTALASEMLGMKLIYLEAGSGAEKCVSKEMIIAVKQSVEIPLIVGGGIDSKEKAKNALDAGADMIVIGNAFERNKDFLIEIIKLFEKYN